MIAQAFEPGPQHGLDKSAERAPAHQRFASVVTWRVEPEVYLV